MGHQCIYDANVAEAVSVINRKLTFNLTLLITEFIGRFHPVLVHLPIGILLFAAIVQWLSIKEKFASLEVVVPIAYLVGCIAAIASCITGWLLADSGEYDEQTLLLHRWMGIVVSIFAVLSYSLIGRNTKNTSRYVALAMVVLISITGHLGGTLTHGDGYLTKAISLDPKDAELAQKNIPNAQEAIVYADIIEPILHQKCYGCHGANKQKGGLRLDSKEWMLKGGKEGKIIKAGDAVGSEMYHRVLLDPLEEKHMPPKGKPQLSERERVLLEWWINAGHDFNQPAKALEQSTQIKQALAAIEQQSKMAKEPQTGSDVMLPNEAVAAAPTAVIDGLRSKGITILAVAKNSNYLTANCVNLTSLDAESIDWLFSLKKQLIWLKMPAMQMKETDWLKLANCKELRRLNLEHSNINNNAIKALKTLTSLNYLNVVGTKTNATALIELKGLSNLQSLFLAGTNMPAADYLLLKKTMPKTSIDTGGYIVPIFKSDTALVKKK